MEETFPLQTYFIEYLRDIRGVSDASVRHYQEALRWISEYLKGKHLLEDSLYALQDVQRLKDLRDLLFADPEFIALNTRGHQMYSAGINNYLRFAEARDFRSIGPKLTRLDKPMPPVEKAASAHDSWKRSAIIRDQALEAAGFRCEVDRAHRTFTARGTKHPYAEGHHLIPLKNQPHIPPQPGCVRQHPLPVPHVPPFPALRHHAGQAPRPPADLQPAGGPARRQRDPPEQERI